MQVLDGGRLKLSRKATQIDEGQQEQKTEEPEERKIYR